MKFLDGFNALFGPVQGMGALSDHFHPFLIAENELLERQFAFLEFLDDLLEPRGSIFKGEGGLIVIGVLGAHEVRETTTR